MDPAATALGPTLMRTQPPYRVWAPIAFARTGLVMLAAAGVGALTSTQWIWIFIGGMWVSRMQVSTGGGAGGKARARRRAERCRVRTPHRPAAA